MINYSLMRGGTKARPRNIVFMEQAGRKEFIKAALLVFFHQTHICCSGWSCRLAARDQIKLAHTPIFFGFLVKYISR